MDTQFVRIYHCWLNCYQRHDLYKYLNIYIPYVNYYWLFIVTAVGVIVVRNDYSLLGIGLSRKYVLIASSFLFEFVAIFIYLYEYIVYQIIQITTGYI